MYLDRHTGITLNIITTDRHTDSPPQAVHPMGSRSRGCAGTWSPEPIKWSRWINSVRRARLCLGGRCHTASTTTAPVAPTHPPGRRPWAPALRLPALTCFTQGCSPGPAPVPAAAPAPCQQVKMVRRNAEPLFLKIYEETQAYN